MQVSPVATIQRQEDVARYLDHLCHRRVMGFKERVSIRNPTQHYSHEQPSSSSWRRRKQAWEASVSEK